MSRQDAKETIRFSGFPGSKRTETLGGDEIPIWRLLGNSDTIAEIRCAENTPALFVRWPNREQAAWASGPESTVVAVCILDSGVTQAHPLLAPAPEEATICENLSRGIRPYDAVDDGLAR